MYSHAFMQSFRCIAEKCPETCCSGWAMPVDAPQIERVAMHAPELSMTFDSNAMEMKRDAAGACVRLEEGLCGITRDYGSHLLSDSCHFFPRRFIRIMMEREERQGRDREAQRNEGSARRQDATREQTLFQSATLSCPEAARLFLVTSQPLAQKEGDAPERLPNRIASPLQGDAEQSLHAQCMAHLYKATLSPSQALADLIHHAYRWQEQSKESWGIHTDTCSRELDDCQEQSPANTPTDPIALTYALAMLSLLGDVPPRPRLVSVIKQMESALAIRIDFATRSLNTTPGTASRLTALDMLATEAAHPWLRDWLCHQLHASAFPFGGLHRTSVRDRITLIAVRYATLRLALACHPGVHGEACADIVQPLARLVDHQADHAHALRLAQDAGWGTEARLLGLVVGHPPEKIDRAGTIA